MGLFTFLKSLFSSKEFVTDGAPQFEIPVTKEVEVVNEPVEEVVTTTVTTATTEQSAPKKVKAKKVVKTSAKPKKPKASKKKSEL